MFDIDVVKIEYRRCFFFVIEPKKPEFGSLETFNNHNKKKVN